MSGHHDHDGGHHFKATRQVQGGEPRSTTDAEKHYLYSDQAERALLAINSACYYRRLIKNCRIIYNDAQLKYQRSNDADHQVLINSYERLKPLMFAIYMCSFINEEKTRVEAHSFWKAIYDKHDDKHQRYTELASKLENYIYRYPNNCSPAVYADAINQIFHDLQDVVNMNRRSKSEKNGKEPESAEKFRRLKLALTTYHIDFPERIVRESVVEAVGGCSSSFRAGSGSGSSY